MKKFSILFVVIILLCCGFRDNEVSFTKEFKITTPANITVSTTGGNISATGSDKDIVEIDFIVRKRGHLLQISLEELQKLVDLEIINENNNLQISIKNNFMENISVGFNIKAPFKSSCHLNTSGGNISIADLNGVQDINTSGGNLDIKNIIGKIDGHTSGGNVDIENSKADIVAKTNGGNMNLKNIDGKVEAKTSGGNIVIDNSKFDVNAETSGGSIDFNDVQGQIDVNTSGGHIKLDNVSGSILAKTSGGNIKAHIIKLNEKLILKTSGGDIDVDIPSGLGLDLNLSADKVNTQLDNFKGRTEKGKVTGQMNGGGIQVDLSTSGGDVNLNFK
jgi:hypothetical protein